MTERFRFSELSLSRLKNVHPDLVQVVNRAIQITHVDFMVVEGRRTLARQRMLVRQGKSQTLNSRHLTGHAIDLCAWVADSSGNGKLAWGKPHNEQVAQAMKKAAEDLKVEIDWGGDWRSFKDTPHFQLDWGAYPKQQTWQASPGETPKPIKASRKRKVMRKASRKWRALDLLKSLQAFLGLSSAAGSVAVLNTSKANLDALGAILGDYGWIGLLAAGGVFAGLMLASQWLQDKQMQDMDDGRYVPSGDEESEVQ